MSPWLIAALAGVVFAFIQYAGRDLRLGARVIAPALLRVGAVMLLVALLLDAPAGPRRRLANWVALDASASWRRGGVSTAWRRAWCDVRAAQPESLFLFGDSLCPLPRGGRLTTPADLAVTAAP